MIGGALERGSRKALRPAPYERRDVLTLEDVTRLTPRLGKRGCRHYLSVEPVGKAPVARASRKRACRHRRVGEAGRPIVKGQ